MSAAGEPVCATHGALATGACARCGAFACPDCGGAPPNDDLCGRCALRAGGLPWERERAQVGLVRAWARTVWRVTTEPERAAHAVPRDGPLAPALAFAGISLAVHLVTSTVLVGLFLWNHVEAWIERFGARDSVGRIVGAMEIIDAAQAIPLAAVVGASALPCALAAATRTVGGDVAWREHVRVAAYACGLLVTATVPLVGLLTILVLPGFLGSWLHARTALGASRRAVAVGAAMTATALAVIAASVIYDLTIAPAVGESALPYL